MRTGIVVVILLAAGLAVALTVGVLTKDWFLVAGSMVGIIGSVSVVGHGRRALSPDAPAGPPWSITGAASMFLMPAGLWAVLATAMVRIAPDPGVRSLATVPGAVIFGVLFTAVFSFWLARQRDALHRGQ